LSSEKSVGEKTVTNGAKWRVSILALAVGLWCGATQAQTLRTGHPYLTFSDKHVAQFKARVADDANAKAAWTRARGPGRRRAGA
jgi:hypothetical protein